MFQFGISNFFLCDTHGGLPVRHLEFEREIADHPLVQSAQEALRLGHWDHRSVGALRRVLVSAAERLSSLETQRQLIDAIFSGESLPQEVNFRPKILHCSKISRHD